MRVTCFEDLIGQRGGGGRDQQIRETMSLGEFLQRPLSEGTTAQIGESRCGTTLVIHAAERYGNAGGYWRRADQAVGVHREEYRVIPRVDVLGVTVSAITMEIAVREIAGWIADGRQHYVCVTGVHGVMEAQRDPALLRIHNESGLTTPDGMPLVWAARWAGAHVSRVYGPDLMLKLCALAAQRGWRSFFYGGKPGVAQLLAQRLAARFPGMVVAGVYSPPFGELTPEQDTGVVEQINTAGPDIVWVGLGTPKQERWMAAHTGRVLAPALIGVGAAFDIHAGLSPQAPRWIRHSGTEWLYRLAHEPRRLWRRYLCNNPAFLIALARRPPRINATAP